jgi:hypothetical protein
MATIVEIKDRVKQMMKEAYASATPADEVKDDSQIESLSFMRAADATAIRKCCKDHTLKVSFRTAGMDTINRIKNNNPCKGHNIMDKSIKKKGENWTYQADATTLSKFNGLVGYGEGSPVKVLKGVWALDIDKDVKKELSDPKLVISNCYTGDYDMHDLIQKNNRILATTPDEHSIIEFLNNAMLQSDATRKGNVDKTKGTKRNYESPYALIRHGAQTSFMSYLLSNPSELSKGIPPSDNLIRIPYEDQVMNIDSNILMFDESGRTFNLDSVSKVYWYYDKNGLLDQIPFYYFMKDLKTNDKYSEELGGFATDINNMLKNYINH